MKIRNTKSSWLKYVGQRVNIWEDDSAWDGSGEWFEPYVIEVTTCGVWFNNSLEENVFSHWVNFKNIKGYSK